MQKKRKEMRTISITGAQGIPASYGGFETLTERICEGLNSYYKFNIYCEKKYRKTKFKISNVKRIFLNFKANGFSSLIYDSLSITHAAFNSDLILQLGSTAGFIIPLIKLIRNEVIIIVNIDGLEWKRDKWNIFAKYLLKVLEKLSVYFCDSIVVDNQGISDYLKNEYPQKVLNKSKLIAYGGIENINISNSNNFGNLSVKTIKNKNKKLKKGSYFICVCRPVPENNLHLIVNTFLLQAKLKRLVLICNWDDSKYSQDILNLALKSNNIILCKPIYKKIKLALLFKNSLGYIHGHKCGGTNPSLIEAISCDAMAFSYDINFNRYSTYDKGFFWKNSLELAKCLLDYQKNRYQYLELKKVYLKYYQWKIINQKYKRLFENNLQSIY